MITKIRSKHIGALLGLAFGWVAVQYGFYQAVFVAVLTAAGWWIGKVLDGETSLLEYLQRRRDDELD